MSPSQRLRAFAAQMWNDSDRSFLSDVRHRATNLMDQIADELEASRPEDAATIDDICAAIRTASTEGALAEAWLGSRARRLELSMINRLRAVESWIDAQSYLGDDGK